MQDERYTIKTNALIVNSAQTVRNRLREMESKRAHVLTRWVWELLQNARDAAVPDTEGKLAASIEQNQTEIVFKHNGTDFTKDQIAHVIYHGSTKTENTESIGQYGTGFLSTHLLSPEINISGWLEDGKKFNFDLKREVSSDSELSESMDRAYDAFWNSLSDSSPADGFTTHFRYPLNFRNDALEAAEKGIESLQRCAPYVVAFNKEFSRIDIKSPNRSTAFTVVDRRPLEEDGIHQVTVAEIENGEIREKKYLVKQGEKASVAIPMESVGDVCLPVEEIPRLFLGFPLINTENFSFPAVINSFRFTPTENRNGVPIGLNDNEANQENQNVIEEACGLLIDMLQYAARFGWLNAHLLANIPAIQGQDWLDPEWLRDCLKERLVDEIRQIPLVINESGGVIPSDDLELPLADTDQGTEGLWDLLNGWEGSLDRLPRRDEAAGWCNAVRTWAEVLRCDISSFKETTDGRKLAARIQDISHDPSTNPATYRISRLDISEGVEAVKWLDQFITFLNNNGLSEVMSEYRVVPSQEAFLRTLSKLHRDCGIDDELKTIAGLLKWRIKLELRDAEVTSLGEYPGAGDRDNKNVVAELIKKLQERAEKDPGDNFSEACVRIFAWIVGQENYDLLRGFPIFVNERGSDKPAVSYLPRNAQDSDRPLAPVRAWPKDLQQFSDLFPPSYILADDFFEKVPDTDAWQTLAQQSFVRTSVVITSDANINKFYPDHPLSGETSAHRTSNPVTMTDIVSRITIMERVRDSQDRARVFWRFLTEWLIKEAPESLEIKKADCECGKPHRYYPAAWLESSRDTAWIRTSNDARVQATAQTLADLLRDRWDPASLSENPVSIKLLEAMGITHFDLLRAFIAKNPDQSKEQDKFLAEILVASGGSTSHLNHAREYIEALKEDEDLPSILIKHRERRQRVIENQSLGKLVEDLVKASLKGEGFSVRRKPIGSDFEIENDVVEKDGKDGTEEEIGIEVTGKGLTWLVEVKATRGQPDVGMTPTQAKTAVAQDGRFLLCVVPVAPGNAEPTLDEVRANLRFVQNIGPRVARVCDDLANLDGLHGQINSDNTSDVHLVVVPGTARVRVKNSVWEDENDGFSIGDLRSRLLGP